MNRGTEEGLHGRETVDVKASCGFLYLCQSPTSVGLKKQAEVGWEWGQELINYKQTTLEKDDMV